MRTKLLASIGIIILLAAAAGVYKLSRHTTGASSAAQTGSCVRQTFAVGSRGNCVMDIQTMVDYLETSGLTACTMRGAVPVPQSGIYDGATASQVRVVQTWVGCYNHEEGLGAAAPASGTVTTATWSELCSFGYQLAKQATTHSSSSASASIAAGKAAGCP